MILHYLKIAWRNLLKYRMQSFVNIFGLAVGFACFALSAMWMRYELSYDNSESIWPIESVQHTRVDMICRQQMLSPC